MEINTSKLVCNVKGHQDIGWQTFNDNPSILLTCRECGELFVIEDKDHINDIKSCISPDIFARLKERMELW